MVRDITKDNCWLKVFVRLPDTNMLSIKVAVWWVIHVGLVMVGNMSWSNRVSKNCCVILCSELFNRSKLWSIPNINSFLSLCVFDIISCISLIKFFDLSLGGLYRLPITIHLPFLALISTNVDSSSFSLNFINFECLLHVMPSRTNIVVPPLKFSSWVNKYCISRHI